MNASYMTIMPKFYSCITCTVQYSDKIFLRGAPLKPPFSHGARKHKPLVQNQKTVNESTSLYLHRLWQHPCCQSSGFICTLALSREWA